MSSRPRPPKSLRDDGKRLWSVVTEAYDLEPDALEVLRLACEAEDRRADAKRFLDANGISYTNTAGVPRMRPEFIAERDSRSAVARLLKQLGLDLEPVNDRPGRPPGSTKRGH